MPERRPPDGNVRAVLPAGKPQPLSLYRTFPRPSAHSTRGPKPDT